MASMMRKCNMLRTLSSEFIHAGNANVCTRTGTRSSVDEVSVVVALKRSRLL